MFAVIRNSQLYRFYVNFKQRFAAIERYHFVFFLSLFFFFYTLCTAKVDSTLAALLPSRTQQQADSFVEFQVTRAS